MLRFSPLRTAIFYFILGMFFTYLAINSLDNSSWTIVTVILTLIATFDFGVSIRAFNIYRRMKQENRK